MQLFYSKDIASTLYLNKEESKHCSQVLRKKKNDVIFITDGNGFLYECEIQKIKTEKVDIKIIKSHQELRKKKFELAISFPKQRNRVEWIIEKATEIGVDIITPIICEKSERTKINIDRIKKIATSSMKQSLRTFKPEISEMIDFSKFVKTNKFKHKFIAHCKEDPEKKTIKKLKYNNACIVIGPEGDFSKKEIKMANDANFLSVSLSKNRLRTDTAAIVSCYTLISENE